MSYFHWVSIHCNYSFSYYVHWGKNEFNGTYDVIINNTATISSLTTTYDSIGHYDVTISAENPLSYQEILLQLTIRGVINSFDFFNPLDAIPVVVTNTLQQVDVMADGAGVADLNYECTDVDGTVYPFNSDVTLSNYFVFESTKPYSVEQDVFCKLNLTTPLDATNVIATYGVVEDIIVPPTLTVPFIPTNETFTYELTEHIGTNVTYRWNFGNGDILWTNGTFDKRTIDYAFNKYGNYTIEVHMWNQVSNSTITVDITIVDTLAGLEFTAEIFDSHFEQATNISFSLKVGTAVNIWIDYGYSVSGTPVKSPVAFDMDTVGYALFGRGSYTYPQRGVYNVSVICTNPVSHAQIWKEVSIETAVEGFEVTLKQANEGTHKLDFLEQDEELEVVTSITAGDNVKYYYDVGDGRDVIKTTNTSIKIKYSKWRVDPPYTIRVWAVNIISNETQETSIAVQRSIQPLEGFNLIHGPENTTEDMEIKLELTSGDYFDCSFDWGDGHTEYLSYDDYLLKTGILYHRFVDEGGWPVKMNCSSRLYEIELNITAYSYTPVGSFGIFTYKVCPGEEGKLIEGAGILKDEFPIECPVMFYCTGQKGTNVTYHFDFGHANEEGVRATSSQYLVTHNETYHTFMFPTKPVTNHKYFKVQITAESAVGSYIMYKQVHMMESILNFTVGLKEETVMIGQLANFTATIINNPYKPCFSIDYGDKFEKEEYKLEFFGHSECTTQPDYTGQVYLKGFETTQVGVALPLQSYKYLDVLSYPITVTAKNSVSMMIFTTTVKISDLRCEPPITTFDTALAKKIQDAGEKSPMMRCRKYSVLTKVVVDCLKKPVSVQRSWALKRVNMINDTELGEIRTEVLEEIEVPGKLITSALQTFTCC